MKKLVMSFSVLISMPLYAHVVDSDPIISMGANNSIRVEITSLNLKPNSKIPTICELEFTKRSQFGYPRRRGTVYYGSLGERTEVVKFIATTKGENRFENDRILNARGATLTDKLVNRKGTETFDIYSGGESIERTYYSLIVPMVSEAGMKFELQLKFDKMVFDSPVGKSYTPFVAYDGMPSLGDFKQALAECANKPKSDFNGNVNIVFEQATPVLGD